MKPTTVSLFCGGGGESAGKELAFKELGINTVDMVSHAVNHWDLAVATHGANFPHIHVHQEDITEVTAASFGVSHIDLLWASPSCVHHSRARGGKPKDDQQAPQDPLHAVTTVARHALCTVEIEGETFAIVDIGMRMLEPKELAAAMGFPENFKWQDAEGKPLTKRDTIKMIGNACPVNTVCALIKSVVLQRPNIFHKLKEEIA